MPPNHLIDEKSPYLLQHAHNPVAWHPWGDAAFDRAKSEDKPIFLSVGYATCHWCHVMERESFEDQEAAEYLNDTFICIKVDREERPDVDTLYMAACQMFNGNGGWPLTIFMTPDKQPFFAATYIPKKSSFGRVGLIDLCTRVKQLWQEEREKLMATAKSVIAQLNTAFTFPAASGLQPAVLEKAYAAIEESFDPDSGGFGPAPKFPTPHRLQYLLRVYHRTGNKNALAMVRHTLGAMRLGGIYDHVGFGFHRYSTDAQWRLPHFEKMLYDQALMAVAYLEAYQISGGADEAAAAREIFQYVMQEMTDAKGGFYTAQDADSEGEEGKFYVWTLEEFHRVVGTSAAERFTGLFNLEPSGNFKDEATGRLTGANILYLNRPFSAEDTTLRQQWNAAREKLFQARAHRVPPLKDDKILTDWNGMMIAALALGARVFGSAAYEEAAVNAARFILRRLTDSSGRLLHRYRDGEAAISAHADDYACFIHGLLALYRTTFDLDFMETAMALQNRMIRDFWDETHGGFHMTASQNTDLPARPKEIYDGATPSANAVALSNLLILDGITGDPFWRKRADALVDAVAGPVASHPQGFTAFLMGAARCLLGGKSVVLASPDDLSKAEPMRQRLNRAFLPDTTVMVKQPKDVHRLGRIAPFTRDMTPLQDRATAYVCRDAVCAETTTDPDRLMEMLAH